MTRKIAGWISLCWLALGASAVRAESMIPKMPPDISLDGYRIDDAFDLTTKLITFYFILVLGLLGYCLLRYRSGEGKKASYFHGNQRKHLMLSAGLGLLVFTTVDLNLVGKARADLHEAFWNYPDPTKALRVEVMGQQWAWNFRYAGDDGEFNTEDDVVMLNDLRIPQDRPVLFQIRSKDVIHSFYLPNFRVKKDANPGRTSILWVQAKETGSYEIACAEHCGFAHYQMRSKIHVLSPKDFETWYQGAAADSRKLFRSDDVQAQWGWAWETNAQ